MSLNEMPSMVLVFVVAFVILGFGALIVGKVDASTADTSASQVLGNASTGMDNYELRNSSLMLSILAPMPRPLRQ